MMDETYIDLVTAYIQDNLSPAQREQLNELIEQGEIDVIDLKEMEMLYKQLGSVTVPEPDNRMRKRFYTMLEQHTVKESRGIADLLKKRIESLLDQVTIRKLAYAFTLFIAGLLVGDLFAPLSNQNDKIDRLSHEVSRMREVMMVTLMDNDSPIERLKAVNIGNDIKTADENIIKALLNTLNHDPNVNVRVAAVEALTKHGEDPQVREGMIDAIANQDSPIVQASLADAMLLLQEKRSVEEFKKLLEKDDLHNQVRDKLENTIAALN